MSKPPGGKKEKVQLASRRANAFNGRVNVFAYGTLMLDEVWEFVTGRIHPSTPGTLADHRVRKLAGQTFPGMIPATGDLARGRVWRDVTTTDLEKLDRFESGIYQRETVNVQCGDGGPCSCWAYLIRPANQGMLLEEPWDLDEFRRLHLETYLD
jgi:gamma-glutamylcyclotransferase (GGCT)/AIG2-like uncharacterized protein YtfP